MNYAKTLDKDLVFINKVDKNGKKRHEYWYKGERKMGVTTIINATIPKPQLLYWAVKETVNYLDENLPAGVALTLVEKNGLLEAAKKAHENIKEEAAKIGTMAHKWVENHIKGIDQGMPEDDRVLNGVNAFLKWEEEQKPKYMFSEKRLYSLKWDVSGTADVMAKIGGKLWLLDVKTGNGIYDEAFIQTAAYRAILREMGHKVEPIGIIRLGKEDGNFQHVEVKNGLIQKYEDRFDLCVKSYFLDRSIKKHEE